MSSSNIDSRSSPLMFSNDINRAKRKQLLKKKSTKIYYKVFGIRYYVLFVYSMIICFNGVGWISLSSILEEIPTLYNVTDYIATLSTLLNSIMFTPGLILALLFYNRYGLRNGLLIGITLQVIGSIIKGFINFNFLWVLIGQGGGGIGQPFIVITPALLATKWFENTKRPFVIIFGCIFFLIGIAVGFIVSISFIDGSITDPARNRKQILHSLIVEASFGGLVLLLALITFPKKPKYPPSPLATHPKDDDIIGCLRILLTNRQFLINFIGYSGYFSNIMVLAVLIDFIVSMFGFGSDQSGFLGAMMMLGGFIGLVSYSMFLK